MGQGLDTPPHAPLRHGVLGMGVAWHTFDVQSPLRVQPRLPFLMQLLLVYLGDQLVVKLLFSLCSLCVLPQNRS